MRKIVKDISYSVLTNGTITTINVIAMLILPKILNVENYGYYQFFTFLCSYVGVLNFGWADGFYLRYCGTSYDQYDRKLLNGQIKIYLLFQIFWALIVSVCANEQELSDKRTIYFVVAIIIIIANISTLLSYILQASNRIKEYSLSSISGNVVKLVLFLAFIFIGKRKYLFYIFAYLAGNMVTLTVQLIFCRDIIFNIQIGKSKFVPQQIKETKANIIVGSKIAIAVIANTLIVGIARYFVELKWSIEAFAKISLTLAVSNLLMTFINAVSLVLLPRLRQIKEETALKLYKKLDVGIVIILSGSMLLYYPSYLIISCWLPQYKESLSYMAILFPISIFEGKNSLLLSTYLKLFRKERRIMQINIVTMVLSLLFSAVSVFILESINLTILVILFVIIFRCVVLELFISKELSIKVSDTVFAEISISICFVYASWVIGGLSGVAIYFAYFLFILVLKKAEIRAMFIK